MESESSSLTLTDQISFFDCLYFLRYALVIAWFRVQYGQYFPSFSYFADLFHEPLGESSINENMLLTNGRFKFRFKVCDRLLKLTVTIPAEDP